MLKRSANRARATSPRSLSRQRARLTCTSLTQPPHCICICTSLPTIQSPKDSPAMDGHTPRSLRRQLRIRYGRRSLHSDVRGPLLSREMDDERLSAPRRGAPFRGCSHSRGGGGDHAAVQAAAGRGAVARFSLSARLCRECDACGTHGGLFRRERPCGVSRSVRDVKHRHPRPPPPACASLVTRSLSKSRRWQGAPADSAHADAAQPAPATAAT